MPVPDRAGVPSCGLIPGHPAIPAAWARLARQRTGPSFTDPKADPKKRTTAHFWTGFIHLLGGLPAACAYPASGPPSAACACWSPPRPGAIAATRPCPSRGARASTDQTSARSPRACGRSRRRGCRIRLAEGVDDLRFREPALFYGRRPPLGELEHRHPHSSGGPTFGEPGTLHIRAPVGAGT